MVFSLYSWHSKELHNKAQPLADRGEGVNIEKIREVDTIVYILGLKIWANLNCCVKLLFRSFWADFMLR